MNKKVIIGLIGPKECGKSTTGRIIEEFYNSKEHAFADKLKNVSSTVFGVPRNHFDDQSIKEVPFENPKILTVESLWEIYSLFREDAIKTGVNIINLREKGLVNIPLTTPRKIAQIVGTEVLRDQMYTDVHCDTIKPNLINGVNVVTDVRFPNEFDFCQREGLFIPVYIYRKEAEDKIGSDAHPSEMFVLKLKEKCNILDNNGSIGDLQTNIKVLIDSKMYGVQNG